MGRSFLPVSVTAILLAACSPAAYKVNPPSVAVEDSTPARNAEGTSSSTWRDDLNEPVVEEEPEIAEEIPESQKEGYMRIIADLRWDQLTSQKEWIKRFPKCLTDVRYIKKDGENVYFKDIVSNKIPLSGNMYVSDSRECTDFFAGGIPLSPRWVTFGSNSGTDSKTMTTMAEFEFFDDSQSRAVKAALAQKYNYTTDGHCSKYTCWDLGDVDKSGNIEATPTPYTVSLLDQVQIDTSDF